MMDPSKLDKMKVVELRAELVARGLDSKGVKAVLVDRLKQALEDGVPVSDDSVRMEREPSVPPPETPGPAATPSRRSRRTRSMTRSPSPPKRLDAALEALAEEAAPIVEEASKTETNEDLDGEPPAKRPSIEPSEPHGSPVKVSATEREKTPVKELAKKEESFSAQENAREKSKVHIQDSTPEAKKTPVKKCESEPMEDVQEGDYEQNETLSAEDLQKSSANIDEGLKTEEEAAKSEVGKPEKGSEEDSKRKLSTEDRRSGGRRNRSYSRSRSRSASPSKSRSRSRSRSRSPRSRSKSRSKSKSKSPKRRRTPETKTIDFRTEEDEPVVDNKVVGLSWFDSDLHLAVEPVSFTSAKPLANGALGLVWAGARANLGVKSGKVAYEVLISEEVTFNAFRDEKNLRGFRCGFSTANSDLMLGEAENSFALCESGKKALNGEFEDFGKAFGLDDTIGCYLDFDSTPCKIEYTLNGESLGAAFEFDKSVLGEDVPLYPHVLTKGYEFKLNFADKENLLGNAERPKREPKKPDVTSPKKGPTPNREKPVESKGEDNWDDEEEAKPPADKDAPPPGEEKPENGEQTGEQAEKVSTDNPEEATKSENPDNGEEVADKEQPESENANHEEKKSEKEESTEEEDQAVVEDVKPREPVCLLEGYELIGLVPEDQLILGPQRPESRKECEVILIVGLPGSGKTKWRANHVNENPDKRYTVIGPDVLIDKMRVDGKPRKSCHVGKWENVYELCLKSLSVLEDIATKRRRNFILDQNNVFASCQRRKMKGFGDFKRIAVICIPSEEELKRRNDLKIADDGIELINETSLNKMKANFTLPSVEFGWFDEVKYTDLEGDEAKEEVKNYNDKGKKAVQAIQAKYKRRRNDNYRRDDRRGGRDDRSRRDDYRGGSRWKDDRRGGRGGNSRWGGASHGGVDKRPHWRDDRGYGGGGGGSGRYDRRDNRFSRGGSGGGGGGGGSWMQNNRGQRYGDDRYGGGRQHYGGGGGGGGGGSRYGGSSGGDYGSSRDYRDRGYDRDRNGGGNSGSSRREGGQRGGNQRDFRAGHRDHHSEDSRGGYDRSSSKYSTDGYDYKSSRAGNSSSKSTNNDTSSQNNWGNNQQQIASSNWSTTSGSHQSQMQPSQQQQQAQGGYWNYDMSQAYGNQQQQWSMGSDPRQQQQWMSWWQQQGNVAMNPQQQQQYWSQYAQAYSQGADSSAMGGHHGSMSTMTPKSSSRSDSKK